MKKILLVFLIFFFGNISFAGDIESGLSAYNNGNYNVAKQYFETALKTNSKNQKARIYLADTLAKLGDFDVAKEHYKIAISQDFASEDAIKARNSLALLNGSLQRLELKKYHYGDKEFLDEYYKNTKLRKWQKLPVSVYIPENENKSVVEKAFLEWELKTAKAVNFEDAKSPQAADIKVNFVDYSAINPENRFVEADCKFNGDYVSSANLKVATKLANGAQVPEEALYNSLLHEIGHIIGLSANTQNQYDAMSDPNTRAIKHLSAQDVRTVKLAYQAPKEEIKPSSDKSKLEKAKFEIESMPSNADGWQKIGDVYFAKKNYYAANECYLRAVGFTSRKPDLYLNMTKSYSALTKYHDAILYGRRGLTIDPNNASILKEVMTAYKKTKNQEEAKLFLETYLKKYPKLKNNPDIKPFVEDYKIDAKK